MAARRFSGAVTVSGSKNATLPILMASLLTAEPVTIRNVPRLRESTPRSHCSVVLASKATGRAITGSTIRAERVTSHEAPYELVKTMRASFFVLGPLLARTGRAKVSTPGGCAIGARPVNLHITGIRALGARIQLRNGYVEAHADGLRGARIWLDTPSVGATENIMMAAVLAHGGTTIENAAREPEVQDLAKFLVAMGANITGAGTHVIEIDGVEKLHGADHEVIPDRIEAGSLMIAAAITGGDVSIRNVPMDQLRAVVDKLRETGVAVIACGRRRARQRGGALRPVELRTLPYPGFPTDLQAQMMALLAQAIGHLRHHRNNFRKSLHACARADADGRRYRHERARLRSFAACRGLQGAPVMATDLRASMGLILAGLSAENSTEIGRVYHLDRGYEALDAKLSSLGARIERVKDIRLGMKPRILKSGTRRSSSDSSRRSLRGAVAATSREHRRRGRENHRAACAERGDRALIDYTLRFDRVKLTAKTIAGIGKRTSRRTRATSESESAGARTRRASGSQRFIRKPSRNRFHISIASGCGLGRWCGRSIASGFMFRAGWARIRPRC